MSKEGKEIEIEEDFIQSSGELLRQARLGKELSITEIRRKTRISKSMVQYLENGEVEKLPGRTYEIGYIKLICQVQIQILILLLRNGLMNIIIIRAQTHIIFQSPRLLQKGQLSQTLVFYFQF